MDKRQLLTSTSLTDISNRIAFESAEEWPMDFPDYVCYVRQLRPGERHPKVKSGSKEYLAFTKGGEFIHGSNHAGELFLYLYRLNLLPVAVH